ELEQDFRRAEAMSRDFGNRYQGKLGGLDGESLGPAITDYEAITEILYKALSYAQLLYAADVSDGERGRFYQTTQERVTDISTTTLFFRLELNRMDDDILAGQLENAKAAHFAPWIRDVRAFRAHQLSDDLEKLLHEKSVSGRAAWVRLFDETEAALRFPLDGKDLSMSDVLNLMSDKDAAQRKKAAKVLGKILSENIKLFSLVTNTLAKDKAIEDSWRSYPRPISERNLSNQVEDEVVDALEGGDWNDLIEFIEWFNLADPVEFREEIGDWCAIDDYIDIYTVRIATADGDFAYHAFKMYNNPADGKWHFVAWDHDMAFDYTYIHSPIDYGTSQHPITGVNLYNFLIDKYIQDDLFRYAYCKKLERFLLDEFSIENTLARADEAFYEIEFDAVRDVHKKGRERPDMFYDSLEPIHMFVEARIPYLLEEIQTFISDPELTPYFRLNEIQSNNTSTIADEAGDYDPWIEIHNLFSVELEPENFILHYGDESWTLPEEAVIDHDSQLLIWLDGEPGEGPLHSSFELTPDAGTLWLECRHGSTADSVVYPALNSDMVWVRSVDGGGIWAESAYPTPGMTNTPPDPSGLVINEFLAVNDGLIADPFGQYDDWVEIYNTTDRDIDLAGIYLTDDFALPMKWAFPDTSIGPYEFMHIWLDQEPLQGPLHATMRLDGGGEQLGLFDRDGVTALDTLTFGDQEPNISYGRFPDGTGDWQFLYTPTPGNPNIEVSVSPIPESSLPRNYELRDCYPNPFNAATLVKFSLPVTSEVSLKIYDVMGRETLNLHEGVVPAGYYGVEADLSGFASGIYFCRMDAGSFSAVRKMLFLK
ncbi:MAG: CotH kinase family protein, partial [FCB group bacterium]|nr:CotH kinase family protein [FCB group bacterium]